MVSIGTFNSKRRHARYLSDHPPFLGSPGNKIGKKFRPSLLNAKNKHRCTCTCTRNTHLPVIAFPFHYVKQEVREEALLNIKCVVKGYHLCRFEVNVGEVFTANKKRGERGNTFKVVNHRGQLGHLQSELVDPLWPLVHANISVQVKRFLLKL